MRNLYSLLLTFFLTFFVASEIKASHLLGSEITYTCIGPNQYRVRLTVYRDCAGISAETSQTFRYSSAQCNVNTTITLSRVQAPVDITPLCPTQASRCGGNGPYGIQEVVYEGTINLPPGCGTDWVLSWNLCCRNDAINNLGSPGNQNMGVTALLDNTIQPCNNSPQFNNVPAAILCINQPFVYNHGVSDSDGDSLFFSLGNCLQNPTSGVNYTGGYNGSNPLPTLSGVTINPNTGAISFTPNQTFVGVICIKVEEYRNGVKIGEVNRDMQFRVINCSNVPPVASGINGSPNNDPVNFEIISCSNSQFCFDIDFSDDNNDNINVTWNQEIVGATFVVTGNNTTSPVGTFCWTPSNNDVGLNVFSVNVTDNACPVVGSGTYTFSVNVFASNNSLNAGADQTICLGESANLTATSSPALSYTWTPGATLNTTTGASVVATPLTTTSYEVTADFADGCQLTDVVVVEVSPDPVISITPLNPFNCANQNNTITATAANAATYSWTPGGFTTPTINVAPAATTTYTVTVTSPFGCVSEASTTVTIAQPAGNVCNVLYVTPTGLPTNEGTRSSPMDLQTAMTVGACNGTIIKMAIGDYVTDTTINRVTSYLTLEGGYDNNVNWEKVSTAGATRILKTATMTTSTTNGSGILDEAGLNPRTVAVSVSGQTGFRFQDLTIETQTLAGGSPILGYRGVNNIGLQLNTCNDYNVVRTQVLAGASSNGSASWCVAPATNGGSTSGIEIVNNGANGFITSSFVSAGVGGTGGAGGVGCPAFAANGANGTTQAVRFVSGTALAQNQSTVNLAALPTIRVDDIACTNTTIGFRTVTSNSWAFGAGSSPTSATGAIVSSMYTNLGRKDISYSGNNYIGFNNIILDDQVIPEFTTSAPFIQGQYRVCAGDSVSFQVTNGGVGYTYIWTSGSLTYQGVGQQFESFILAFDTPGIYPIQLNFETGCCGLSLPTFLDLYVEEQPEAIVPADQEICFGSALGVDLTVSGSVPGGSISWTPSTGLNANDLPTVISNPSSTTTYEVILSDSTGLCVDYAEVTVNVVELVLTTSVVDATCGPDGSATASIVGGSGDYSYLWSDGQTTSTASNLQVGTYTVVVTDNVNGCQDSTFAVVNPSGGALVGFISNSNDVSCFGLSDGSITVTVVGGQAPFTYDWGPQGTTSNSNSTSNTISGLGQGTYDVLITDALSCTYEVTGFVNEPLEVVFDIDTVFDATCGNLSDGYIRVTTDGGVAPYTYSWTGVSGANNNILENVGAGTYTLVATDFNGCIDSIDVTISAPPILTGVIDTSVCLGTSINIAGVFVFVANNDTTISDTVQNSLGCDSLLTLNLTILPSSSGLATYNGCQGDGYSVTVNGVLYNESNPTGTELLPSAIGCDSVVTINLVYLPNSTGDATYSGCQGDGYSVIVNGVLYNEGNPTGTETLPSANGCDSVVTINLVYLPNSTGIDVQTSCDSYTWIDGNTYSEDNNTATFTLVGASQSGCDSIVTLDLSIVPLPIASIEGDTAICIGAETEIIFTGTPNTEVVYTINGGDELTIELDTNGNAILQTGELDELTEYELVSVNYINSDCGQSLVGSATIEINPLPEPIITATPDTIIRDDNTVLEVVGGVVFEWSPVSSTESQVTVSPQDETEYFVTVTDEFGCEAQVSITVYVLDRVVVIALPDAFTPNGDGNNDVFEVFNKGDFSDITMRVYNRWGEQVHEGRGQDHGWDGTFKGKAQSQDVYVYYIEAYSEVTEQTYKVTASFSLIR